mmetsp:Transcript_28574/g.82098  ORF Transcript_28574/g.82098 Transcript_28574/m.82098 type:complete len:229 (+) Transcript_28574:282-968(+)
MAEVPQHVAPGRVVEKRNPGSQLVNQGLQACGVSRGTLTVDGEVQQAKIKLPQHHEALVDVLRCKQRGDVGLRQALPALDVFREPLQHASVVAPILEHLRGGLNEVPGTLRKRRGVCRPLCTKPMHDVTEFVEERHHIVMPQQRRLSVRRGCRQVRQHAIDGRLPGAIRQLLPLQKVEDCRVVVLPVPRVEVQVEVADSLARGRVVHHEQSDLRMPRVELVDLRELEP